MEIQLNTSSQTDSFKKRLYINLAAPALNQEALFADGTASYRNPVEPKAYERVTVKFRTARDNVDAVYLCIDGSRQLMTRCNSDKLFDYYEAFIALGDKPVSYYFQINSGRSKCYYHKKGVDREPNPYYNFTLVPGFSTPDWAKGAVFYQIYVDRFCNGDESNDVVDNEYIYIGEPVHKAKEWSRYPASMDVREFYGGDLQGVRNKLDYLQDLGVEVIYFNPLFVSPSNHKYDIQDYDYIDPHFGRIVSDGGMPLEEGESSNSKATKYIKRVTDKANLEASNQLFIELVEEIHRRGMKVILDGVFNHCGSFNKWLDKERIYENETGYEKGAYVDYESPYHKFFHFHEDDESKWPYNYTYDGWWGHDTLPKLNYEGSEKLYNYILDIGRKWVSPPFNVDGWRLDVAADLGHSPEFNHKFWRDFRKAVKEANPEAIILAEHYGDPGSWLAGDQWDTVMNYDAFMEPLTWFLTGMEKHSDEFRGDLLGNVSAFYGSMTHHMSRFHNSSLQVAMNELSNHDHSRFLTRTNRRVGRTDSLGPEAANENVNKGVLREAVVMQMTWPGAPTIYYGDEAGVCGWTDPDNRRTYPWGNEDKELIRFHRDIIRIHKSSTALKKGSIKHLYGNHKLLCYGRFDENEVYIIAINNNYDSVEVDIPVWQAGVPSGSLLVKLMETTEEGYNMEARQYIVENGCVHINLKKISGIILKML
ncbi:MAG: glycoside hydrolase family 13 protein [Lachnospiraceae bacterium]|nr:glycoside hydrolase family 13 protein [Lachnospiraceae bacterium]